MYVFLSGDVFAAHMTKMQLLYFLYVIVALQLALSAMTLYSILKTQAKKKGMS